MNPWVLVAATIAAVIIMVIIFVVWAAMRITSRPEPTAKKPVTGARTTNVTVRNYYNFREESEKKEDDSGSNGDSGSWFDGDDGE